MATHVFNEGKWEKSETIRDERILGNRVVAFLDILGFKNLVQNNFLTDLARTYEEVVDQINRASRPSEKVKNRPVLFEAHPLDIPYCKLFIFSDSIIIISNGSNKIETLKTLLFTWRTLQQLIVHGLNARGAVSYGEIYINLARNIFLGKALTKAYELEQQQEWIGAIIDNNLFDHFPELKKEFDKQGEFFNKLFLKYSVPFKDKSLQEHYTINWRANLIIEKGARSLFQYTGDPKIDIKFENTLKYCSVAKHFSDEKLTPIELAFYWKGESKPPFQDPD